MPGMEVAGLALTIIATTDLCFKYGKVLVDTCASFKGAEAEVDERVLCVQSHWKRTTMQLDFIKRIWQSLDKEHQTIQEQILQVLISKLTTIISKLEKLCKTTPGKVKKWKYVLIKQCLDESIEELASWQKMFDPTWFLILKVSDPFIDQELSKSGPKASSFPSMCDLRDALKEQPLQESHVFLPQYGPEAAQVREIPFTSAKYVQKLNSDHRYIVDCIPCNPAVDISSVTRDIRELARKLTSVDPLTFGILKCRGVIRTKDPYSGRPTSFDFVFRIPRELGDEPGSLRTYLCSHRNVTLTDRFELAKQLAKSTSYVHTLGFVHKNLRPETVLGFQPIDPGPDMFFLVGFEKVRLADGRTERLGDSSWEKNLYRHPHRQGLKPEVTYSMQHDIYSLGVCLLEVGLWESFLSYTDNATNPLPAAALGVTLDGPEFIQPARMQEHLLALAKRDLPMRMGVRYEKVVVICLTCLDPDNADFGDQTEFEDLDGVLVGVKYIEKILLKLNEIQV